MGELKRKRVVLKVGITSVFMISLLAIACATPYVRTIKAYHGKAKTSEHLTRVIIPSPAYPCSVDGSDEALKGMIRGLYRVLELEPGPHTFQVHMVETRGGIVLSGTQRPRFFLEGPPGSVYVVSMHSTSARGLAYRLNGPYPWRVEIPGTNRTVTLDVKRSAQSGANVDHLAYIVEENGRRKEYRAFQLKQHYPAYSKNGKHVAFFVRNGRNDHQLVVDGVRLPFHFARKYTDVFFSPDGNHYLLALQYQGQPSLLFDGKMMKQSYLRFYGYTVLFSSDSKHVAYVAMMEDEKQHMFVDGRDYGPYRRVDFDSLYFSDDGKSFGYSVEYEPNGGFHPKEISLEGHSIDQVGK